MKSDVLAEASMVDFDDEQLKELLGYLHESIKNLSEKQKKDPDIQQMTEQLKAYKADNYGDEIKRMNARLKAARAHAQARGITWSPPKEENV